MKPEVSVCIPTYRQTTYLQRTLTSVLQQDYSDFEILISDDSENDEVESLVSAFKDKRIRYVRNPRTLGSPANWNTAMQRARADVIKIMHHDDWFADCHSLGAFMDLLKRDEQTLFAFSGTTITDAAGQAKRTHAITATELEQLSSHPELLMMGNSIGSPSATIFHRRLGLEFDPRYLWLVDLEFYIRALRKSPHVNFTAQALIHTPEHVSHQLTMTCLADPELIAREHLMLEQQITQAARPGLRLRRQLLAQVFSVLSNAEKNGVDIGRLIRGPSIPPLSRAYYFVSRVSRYASRKFFRLRQGTP